MKRTFVVILAALFASGCASITRGTTEIFVIETTPPNARATLSTGLTCTTPCSLKVPRRGDFVVTLEREGYERVRFAIASSIDGDGAAGMAGNVIFGGIVGAGIDAGTGAMHSHQPNPLAVMLIPLGATPEDIAALQSAAAQSEESAGGEAAKQVAAKLVGEDVDEAAEDLAGDESAE